MRCLRKRIGIITISEVQSLSITGNDKGFEAMNRSPSRSIARYPESDGQPMGETELHIEVMIRLWQQLRHHFQDQDAHVGADLLLYYVEGDNRRVVVPDVFVTLGMSKQRRRTYKLWEEIKAPDVVFEITSKSSQRRDLHQKPSIYRAIGVREYFLFDPTSDYLDPRLQGFDFSRTTADTLTDEGRILPDSQGRLRSDALRLAFDFAVDHMGDAELVVYDSESGSRLLTGEEAQRLAFEREKSLRIEEAARGELEDLRHQAERERRLEAERRVLELEAELQRIQAERRRLH